VHRGNIAEMAKALKMDRSHLYTKLKDFDIHRVGQKGAKLKG
jgi:transcriptional regulator of acetoin/glycerol metabolism